MLGNPMTEPFVVNKYNIPSMLHIKLNPKYPDALVNGVVGYLNGEEFDSIFNTSPSKEMIDGDEELRKAIEESKQYFDLSVPLEDEGNGECRELTDKGSLPLWAYGIATGGDFWADVIVDDYDHPVKTEQVGFELRRLFYEILGRDKVVEHQPVGDKIVANEVQASEGFMKFNDLRKLLADPKKKANLGKMFSKIAHMNFPSLKMKTDPLDKIGGPLVVAGLAIRFLISVCFTKNQADYTLLPEDGPEELKKAGVVGAPPLDFFEVQALALCVLVLCTGNASKFESTGFKPTMRRVKVSALYQSTLMHLIWLQELFGIKSQDLRPHFVFDGEIFAAAYESRVEAEAFAAYFKEPEAIVKLFDTKFKIYVDAIMAPFPEGLFDAFMSVPRSIAASAFEQSKPVTHEVIVHKSAFAALMDSDSEYDDEEPAPQTAPPPVSIPAPAPKAAPPPPKKQQKKGKADEEEDDLEAFLIAQAAKNAQSGEKAAARPAPKAEKKKPARKHVRRQDTGGNANPQVFNRESKNELKRQLKQQIYDYN